VKRPSNRAFFVAFLLVSLLVAGVASYYASSHPDGLNYVADKTGFIDAQKPHATSDSPFAGYATEGVDDGRLSGGLAGVVGVVVMLGLSTGLFWVLRRRSASRDGDESADQHADELADAPTDSRD
jgi:cobalt/nickel transport system permease protein/cobalt/nickel transport protein